MNTTISYTASSCDNYKDALRLRQYHILPYICKNGIYTMAKILFTITLIGLFISCKKSTPLPVDTCKVSATSILGKYSKTSEKYKASNSAAIQDIYSGLPDCEKDDLLVLLPDSSVAVEDGSLLCGGPPPPGGISNWYLYNENTHLALGGFFTIDSFNCKRLVLTEENIYVDGDSRTVVYEKK